MQCQYSQWLMASASETRGAGASAPGWWPGGGASTQEERLAQVRQESGPGCSCQFWVASTDSLKEFLHEVYVQHTGGDGVLDESFCVDVLGSFALDAPWWTRLCPEAITHLFLIVLDQDLALCVHTAEHRAPRFVTFQAGHAKLESRSGSAGSASTPASPAMR